MSAISPWDFKHLEVVGTRVSSPVEFAEIRDRIPQLKVETRKRSADRKPAEITKQRTPRSLSKRQSFLYVKPQKEKVVTVKVVIPKKKSETIERNYLCSCEDELSGHVKNNEADEIEFKALMAVFSKFSVGPTKEYASRKLKNIAKGFHGSTVLTDTEAIEVSVILVKERDTTNTTKVSNLRL